MKRRIAKGNFKQREFVKKLPLSFKYTHNAYFYKGSRIFASTHHAIHTRKKQKSNIFQHARL